MAEIGGVTVVPDSGLAYKGTVTAVPGANQFIIPSLAGLGVGKFSGATNPFYAVVVQKGTGTSGTPQGQQQIITAYNNATGQFTTLPFTVPIAVGDQVQILSADLAANPTILAAISSGSGGITSFDTIYFSKNNGGTLAGGADGSPTKPINNLADLLIQFAAKKLRKIFVLDELEIDNTTVFPVDAVTGGPPYVEFLGLGPDSSEITIKVKAGNLQTVQLTNICALIYDWNTFRPLNLDNCYLICTRNPIGPGPGMSQGNIYAYQSWGAELQYVSGLSNISIEGPGNVDIANVSSTGYILINGAMEGVNVRNYTGFQLTVTNSGVFTYQNSNGGLQAKNCTEADIHDITGGNVDIEHCSRVALKNIGKVVLTVTDCDDVSCVVIDTATVNLNNITSQTSLTSVPGANSYIYANNGVDTYINGTGGNVYVDGSANVFDSSGGAVTVVDNTLENKIGGGGPTDWDAIYFDPANGNTLAAGNDGTPLKPLSLETDVLTQIAVKKLSKVKICASEGHGGSAVIFTVPGDISGIAFYGEGEDTGISFNPSYSAYGCYFHYVGLNGTVGAAGYSQAYNCYVNGFTDNNGWDYYDSTINGLVVGPGSLPYLFRCTWDDGSLITFSANGATIRIFGTGDVIFFGDDRTLTISGSIQYGVPVSGMVTGTQTDVPNWTVMTDAAATFTPHTLMGLTILDTTDGSHGTITDNDATTITTTGLSGGSLNMFSTGDAYSVTVPVTVVNQETTQYDGVYVDSVNGVAGTGAGIGTPNNPSSNLTDALVIAGTRKTTLFQIRDADNYGLTLPSDLPDNLTFIGTDEVDNAIDLNGKKTNNSVFRNLCIYGATGGQMMALDNCWLTLDNTHVYQAITAKYCYIAGEGSPGYLQIRDSDFSAILHSPSGNLDNISGFIEIKDFVGSTLTIQGVSGLSLTIDASCTGGTINLYGDITLINNSAGTTVNDYTIQSNQVKKASTTIDLNQAAADYDLLTGSAGPVEIDSLIITMPNLVAGGALTSISIQTNDATPQVLIDSTTGVVANLTAEAQLAWQGRVRVGVGKKIQLTIAGGATAGTYVCDVDVEFKSISGGGQLL